MHKRPAVPENIGSGHYLFVLYRFSVLAFCSFLPLTLICSNEKLIPGARASALGGAFTAVNGDIWNIYGNIGALAGIKYSSGGICFERRYFLRELAYTSLSYARPFSKKTFGLSVSSFGFSSYREINIGLAYARLFLKDFSWGIKINSNTVRIPGYGQAHAISLDAGFLAGISGKWSMGFQGYNLTLSKIGNSFKESIPLVLSAGLSFHPSKKVLLTADVEKDIDFKMRFKSGVEYRIIDPLFLRAGISSNPVVLSGGFGLIAAFLNIDFSFAFHEYLGISPTLSVNWENASANRQITK